MGSPWLQIGKKAMSPEILEDLAYGPDVDLIRILGVDQDVQKYDDEDIKLLGENLVDVALEAGWCIGKAKGLNLVLESIVAARAECSIHRLRKSLSSGTHLSNSSM